MMQAALDILYPGQCVSCRNTVASAQGVCPSCWGETPFIDGTICDACGTPLLGEAEGRVWHCDDCIATPRPWDKGRSSLVYKGLARRIVLNLKHGDRQDTAAPLAKWMARAAKGLVPEKGLVAPVPLHWMRMIKRGFNQSAALAHPLAQELGLGFCPDLLQRIRRTASLDGTSRPARFEIRRAA